MWLVIKIIIGIAVAIIGGSIGLRALLYIFVALIAGYASVAMNKSFHIKLRQSLQIFASPTNAAIISAVSLTAIPLLITVYCGRKLVAKLQISESMPPMINSILGSGFALTVYLIALQLF